MPTLHSPVQAGALQLPNRIVMAPLTRTRAGREHIANPMMAEHYAQRASAGLLMSDATMVAADGCAFIAEPGLYDATRIAGYKLVTDAVHAKGGRIIAQIWHPGRAAHSLLNGGVQPISSGTRGIRNDVIHTPKGKQPYEAPRALAREELPGIVAAFRAGAENAKAAGFDGVQVHGAHGYLLDQFLRDSVNDRTDDYGGSLENRARLLLEVVDAAISVWGAERVSVRISPLVAFNDIADSDPVGLTRYVAEQLSQRRIAFLEIRHENQALPEEQAVAAAARAAFKGTLMLNGGFDRESGEAAVASGRADAIVYGKAFIANPDLVERFARKAPLNEVNFNRLYGGGADGYNDYPTLAA